MLLSLILHGALQKTCSFQSGTLHFAIFMDLIICIAITVSTSASGVSESALVTIVVTAEDSNTLICLQVGFVCLFQAVQLTANWLP